MAGSVNKVTLIGHVGKDPEIRHTQDGKAIVNLSLATSESWKAKDGERKEKTEWHRIVIFNEHIAKVAEQYVKKGSSIYVEGQLQTRKWTDKDGQEKYTTEIVLQNYRGELTLLGGKPDGGDTQDQDYAPMTRPRTGEREGVRDFKAAAKQSFARDLDIDDVPFSPEFR